jgi:hypothetical protein
MLTSLSRWLAEGNRAFATVFPLPDQSRDLARDDCVMRLADVDDHGAAADVG